MSTHARTPAALLALPCLLAILAAPLSAQPTRSHSQAQAMPETDIDIPFQKFVLSNGLTLVVHEDHDTPVVAVNVWYHVGSKNEKPGKTGFAHLFEHLMFNGSEHFNDDYFKPFERVGATDQNGTTNNDRTNYFQNIPASALDLALWMESDRMGHLVGAIDQAKLDEQRGVVQNEKRQGENQPYGLAWQQITAATYPAGHPYSWTTIGSMEDLNAASLDDVREWFKTYYGAANAVLVVAGDVDAQDVKARVEKYFGDIPPGPPVARDATWVARMSGMRRQVMQDRVPQSRVYMIWNIPEWGSVDSQYLDLVSDVLASGKTSPLFKRLVYDEQIATDVMAAVQNRQIAGQFVIIATARPDVDLSRVEAAAREELARFLEKGCTARDLERIKTQYRARFLRGVERIGGFGGKSDVLAMSQVYGGRPDAYKERVARIASATPAQLLDAARRWLGDGQFVLEVKPFPKYETSVAKADRSKLPDVATPVAPRFPELRRAKLSNGLAVVLAEHHTIPQVVFHLLVDAGYAADQGAAGTASLTMEMLDEGTRTKNALQLSDELDRLGAVLTTSSDLDSSTVALLALKENLEPSLNLFADIVLHPAFPAADFDRLKAQRLARITREKNEPFAMAARVLPALLYGEGHAYANPFTGSGTEDSVQRITRENLVAFHRAWFRPAASTLVVAGDTTLDEVLPVLERLFAGWEAGEIPGKPIGKVEPPARSVVYLLDRPGSQQSVILAAHVAPPKSAPDDIAIESMNRVLGGTFTSRLNMNLREDKHWSYGTRTMLTPARGPRPFYVMAPVQTDKTKESMTEIVKELEGMRGKIPITADELAKVQDFQTLTLPGRWETMNAVAGTVDDLVQFGLDDRYYDTYAEKVRALTVAEISRVARDLVQPDRLVWVVVGDRAKIEGGVRELALGELRFLDADGRPAGEAIGQ